MSELNLKKSKSKLTFQYARNKALCCLMWQKVLCDCCWVNLCGVCCAGCSCRMLCCGWWCCPKRDLTNSHGLPYDWCECCGCLAPGQCCQQTAGFGCNLFLVGVVCCADGQIKSWSHNKRKYLEDEK